MIIQIKRVTLSGLEYKILLNTRYIIEVRPTEDPDKPRTKIIYDSLRRDEVSIIYTQESIPTIKGKITRGSKNEFE